MAKLNKFAELIIKLCMFSIFSIEIKLLANDFCVISKRREPKSTWFFIFIFLPGNFSVLVVLSHPFSNNSFFRKTFCFESFIIIIFQLQQQKITISFTALTKICIHLPMTWNACKQQLKTCGALNIHNMRNFWELVTSTANSLRNSFIFQEFCIWLFWYTYILRFC